MSKRYAIPLPFTKKDLKDVKFIRNVIPYGNKYLLLGKYDYKNYTLNIEFLFRQKYPFLKMKNAALDKLSKYIDDGILYVSLRDKNGEREKNHVYVYYQVNYVKNY